MVFAQEGGFPLETAIWGSSISSRKSRAGCVCEAILEVHFSGSTLVIHGFFVVSVYYSEELGWRVPQVFVFCCVRPGVDDTCTVGNTVLSRAYEASPEMTRVPVNVPHQSVGR